MGQGQVSLEFKRLGFFWDFGLYIQFLGVFGLQLVYSRYMVQVF